MKTVLIITCGRVLNFGAVLQAYALQKYILNNGHKAILLDYYPDFISRYQKFTYLGSYVHKNFLLKFLYIVYKFFSRYSRLKKFRIFRKNNIIETPYTYKTPTEFKAKIPPADIYLCGSDQIWNLHTSFGHDAVFNLLALPSNCKKYSYAASMGDCVDINESEKQKCKLFLTEFSSISVRESYAKDFLFNEFSFKAECVLDPVFLLGSNEWSLISKQSKLGNSKDSYLLVYPMKKTTKLFWNNAIKLAKSMNLKIYTLAQVNPINSKFSDRVFSSKGPEDFLFLIKNANCIYTNSFHGFAFSLIFRKKFVVSQEQEVFNARIQSLADLLQCDQICKDSQNILSVSCNIKPAVLSNLEIQLRKSQSYLDKILS